MSNQRLVPLNVAALASAPAGTPKIGDLYYNTTNLKTWVYSSGGWVVAAGGGAAFQTSAPTGPQVGDIWVDSDADDVSLTPADFLLNTTAASTYLTQANASSTYLPAATAASTYLPTATAATTYVPLSLADAKGDLVVATADNTVSRLPVGTNNQVLTADSAETSGVKWATPASSSGSGVGVEMVFLLMGV